MSSPSPGWYPSPDQDPNWLRYWDGERWTEHRAPATPGYPGTVASPLAPSGLRRVGALFTDFGTIFRRAWWPITAAGLLLWGLWTVLAVVIAAVLRLGAWSDLWSQYLDLSADYPDGLPLAVSSDLDQQVTDLLQQIGTGTFIAAGIVFLLATVLIGCAHYAAVLRIGAEAASGRPATLSTGLAGARTGALRVLGYNLVVGLPFVVSYVVFVGAMASANGAAILFGALLLIVALVATFVLYGRLLPAFPQATVPNGAGALGWSWRATRGKFWAVLGRYLLWSLVVSVAVNLLYTVLLFPLMFGGVFFAMTASAWVLLLTGLAGILVLAALTGFSIIGYIPIWRDLTTDPEYRAIDPAAAR